MWHDFVQESEGCGAGKPLIEATEALDRMAHFFAKNESCRVVCADGQCTGSAPVKWNFRYHEQPPPTPRDCE